LEPVAVLNNAPYSAALARYCSDVNMASLSVGVPQSVSTADRSRDEKHMGMPQPISEDLSSIRSE
jgi:hypothetical protein